MATRECGDCQACCVALNVDDGDFHKPKGEPCKHLCSSGCGIYSTRPSICASYACIYLAGKEPGREGKLAADLVKENERPDKSGLLISINDANSPFTKFSNEVTFTAFEMKPNAAESYWGTKMVKRIAKKAILFIKHHDGTLSVAGKNDKLMMVTAFERYQNGRIR